jgi:hypothetical protein
MAIQTGASPLVDVKYSEVFSSNWTAIDCGLTDRARIAIENCWLGGKWALGIFQFDKPSREAEVELTDNTLVTDSNLWGHRFNQNPVEFAKEDFRSVRFKVVGNVFQSRREFGVVEYGGADKPNRPAAVADWYRDHITWETSDNLFAIKGDFLAFHQGGKSQELTWKTSKDWQAFWKGEKDLGMEGTPRFAAGNLLERLEKDPLSLTPADFRLQKGSPGQGAVPDGKDLGADMDRIGPGAAYENWQKAPPYQEWLKMTDNLMGRP